MNTIRPRAFTPLQRLLHWLMAIAILAMLFIGVAMVSTVTPAYLTLMSIHKPLGNRDPCPRSPASRRAAAAGCPATPARFARTDAARRASVAHRSLCADDRHAADRLGNALSSGIPDRPIREPIRGRDVAAHPGTRPNTAFPAMDGPSMVRLGLLRVDPAASGGRTLPCVGSTRWRVRADDHRPLIVEPNAGAAIRCLAAFALSCQKGLAISASTCRLVRPISSIKWGLAFDICVEFPAKAFPLAPGRDNASQGRQAVVPTRHFRQLLGHCLPRCLMRGRRRVEVSFMATSIWFEGHEGPRPERG